MNERNASEFVEFYDLGNKKNDKKEKNKKLTKNIKIKKMKKIRFKKKKKIPIKGQFRSEKKIKSWRTNTVFLLRLFACMVASDRRAL